MRIGPFLDKIVVSRWLQRELAELDMHPDLFAETIGISAVHFRSIYNGSVLPASRTLQSITSALGVDHANTLADLEKKSVKRHTVAGSGHAA